MDKGSPKEPVTVDAGMGRIGTYLHLGLADHLLHAIKRRLHAGEWRSPLLADVAVADQEGIEPMKAGDRF